MTAMQKDADGFYTQGQLVSQISTPVASNKDMIAPGTTIPTAPKADEKSPEPGVYPSPTHHIQITK